MKKAAGDGSDLIFRGTTKNFSEAEFYCGCGCGFYNVTERLVFMLQGGRDIAKIPFLVNSGSRCLNHNADVGGVPDSKHRMGLAADICADPAILRKHNVYLSEVEIMGLLVPALLKVGFKRIGIYFHSKFIHVDVSKWYKDQPVKIWGGK